MDKSEKDEIENLISFGDEEAAPNEETVTEDNNENPIDDDNAEQTNVDTEQTDADAEQTDADAEQTDADAEQTEEYIENTDFDDSGIDIEIADAVGKSDTSDNAEYIYDYNNNEPPKKKTHIKWIIAIAAVLAAVTAFAVIDTGIIGAYKRNFAHNFSKIFRISEKPAKVSEIVEEEFTGDAAVYVAPGKKIKSETYKTKVKSSVIIPYEYSSESEYSAYDGGIICAATNHLRFINSKGQTEWECATSVINPILRTAGDYILIVQKNGRKLCLYDGKDLLYDTDCSDAVLNADLSENGDCVLVTSKDLYKGAICAYNKSGKLIYSRSFGDGTVIDAAISPKSRNIAAALLYTDSDVHSKVEIFDIMEQEPKAALEFTDTVLFDAEYFGDIINVFGDNSVACLKSNGALMYDYRFDDANITHFAYDKKGNKLILADNANVPTMAIYNLYGKSKTSFSVTALSDYLAIDGNRVLYNFDREIVTGKVGAKQLYKYTASMDIRDLVMVGTNMFCIVYSNSIELVRM